MRCPLEFENLEIGKFGNANQKMGKWIDIINYLHITSIFKFPNFQII